MLIRIATTNEVDRGVSFVLDGRPLDATWNGDKLPASGDEVDVELDCKQPLVWGTSMRKADEPGDPPSLEGVVEVIDGAVAVLRVGEGLLLVELAGPYPEDLIGKRVAVNSQLTVYPTHT